MEKMVERAVKRALLGEVYTTPKPGLVDCHDTGAHQDMDVHTFRVSTQAITPFLVQMFETGRDQKDCPAEIFRSLRRIGQLAETQMFLATKGINTHKGILFTMGILAGASGICLKRYGYFSAESVFDISREMTEQTLTEELQEMKNILPVSHGEKLYQKYGETGVRGQALRGFPILKEIAWPVLKKCREEGNEENLANLQVVLEVMTELNDTNVLNRSSVDGLNWVQKEAMEIIKIGGAFSKEGLERVKAMNRECIERNISPGGAADILAAAIFLYEMNELYGRERSKAG